MAKFTTSRKVVIVTFWLLTLAWAVFIFVMSNMVATESSELSTGFLDKLMAFFGDWLTEHIVRKAAHAFEFFTLCGLVSGSLYFTFGSPKLVISALVALLYAVSDEIHQIFVPGRACRFFDVLVDFTGIVIMVIFITVVIKITNKHLSKEYFV